MMEDMGRTITVREWAARHSIPERTALYRAKAGLLASAYQSPSGPGGVWLLDEDEPASAPPRGFAHPAHPGRTKK